MLSSEVITQASDRKALELMVTTSEANLAQSVKEIAADAGYSSYDNYEYLAKNDKTGYIPDQNLRKILKKTKIPIVILNFTMTKIRTSFFVPKVKYSSYIRYAGRIAVTGNFRQKFISAKIVLVVKIDHYVPDRSIVPLTWKIGENYFYKCETGYRPR